MNTDKKDNRFLQAAVNYANKGGMKVFPLQPGKKIPYADSSGYKDASHDVNQVITWWEERPESNIAIATGGFFWVLDIDIKSGGIESLDKLLEEHNNGEQLYTFTVKSGGGGYHYYFYYEKDQDNKVKYTVPRSVGKLAPGIDVIAESSYIIGAYSVVNNLYLPLSDLQDMDVAPDWLLNLALEAGSTPVTDVANDDGVIEPGNRNETLTSLAGSLRRVGNDSTQIKKILSEVNTNALSEPLPDREVDTIAQSVSRYEPDHNRIPTTTNTEESELSEPEEQKDRSFTSDFPPGFMTDWIELAKRRSDVAPEYAELSGFVLLAACSPHVSIGTNFDDEGVYTNIYGIIIGTTARSRKTTVIKWVRNALRYVHENLMIPESTSFEGLVQQIAQRNDSSGIQIHDEYDKEFALVTKGGSYKEGIQNMYLQMYDSAEYTHQRRSKLNTEGRQVEDKDRIINPHFNIFGGCTEVLFGKLKDDDINSGFLNRFLISVPEKKQPRKPTGPPIANINDDRQLLWDYLKDLYEYCNEHVVVCTMSAKQYQKIDAFEQELENSNDKIIRRLNTYALKLAMLIQLSIAIPTSDELVISDYALDCAISKSKLFIPQMQKFASEIGGMGVYQKQVNDWMDKILRVLQDGPKSRSYIGRKTKILKDDLTRCAENLEERGDIKRMKEKKNTTVTEIWQLVQR